MRGIALRTLRIFWKQAGRGDAEQPLLTWHHEALRSSWRTPADVKAQHGNASVLKNSRVAFNIAGNKYRLVVHIAHGFGIVYVRFVGTHREYDEIDAETV